MVRKKAARSELGGGSHHADDRSSEPTKHPTMAGPVVEIMRLSDGTESVKVIFQPSEGEDLTRNAFLLAETEDKLVLSRAVTNLRKSCVKKGDAFFCRDIESKMERMMASVAANYPSGLTLDSIVSELAIDRKAARAYMTSANNASSRYLYLDGKQVKTNDAGVIWIWERISKAAKMKSLVKRKEQGTKKGQRNTTR